MKTSWNIWVTLCVALYSVAFVGCASVQTGDQEPGEPPVGPPLVSTRVASITVRVGLNAAPNSAQNCVIPGQAPPAQFSIDTNVDGTYRVVCDLNQDGFFNITDPLDLLLKGDATAATWLDEQLLLSYPVVRNETEIGRLSGSFDLKPLRAELASFALELEAIGDEQRRGSYVWIVGGTMSVIGMLLRTES